MAGKKGNKNKNNLAKRLRAAGIPPPATPRSRVPTDPFAGIDFGPAPASWHPSRQAVQDWIAPPPQRANWYSARSLSPQPTPPPPPPPPAPERFVTPHNHYDLLEKMSTGGGKRFGGLLGDSAALNWILGVLIITVAVCVVVWSQSFLNAYANGKSGKHNYTTGYYVSQYALALAILTLVFMILYIGWVFADARHPMRKAWQASSSAAKNDHPDNFAGLKNAAGNPVNRPGMATRQMWSVNRLTVSRLFAEKRHISKLRIAHIVFFLAWLIPFLLMTFKDGYLTWKHLPNQRNVRLAEVCGEKESHGTCMELAKAGICAGILATLFFISTIACTVASMSRKTS